jgi:pilus assembly protein Flp/PilA
MRAFALKTKTFILDESGPTTTEYAVMLALVIAACAMAITTYGNQVSVSFTNTANQCFG